MAKTTYQRHARGGSFKGRSIPGDDKVTEKEQQIIDFIERQRQQSLTVRTEAEEGISNVMANEAENRAELQQLEVDLWGAKRQNVQKRQQTEVDYYTGLAREAQKKADFYTQWSPKLGADAQKFVKGALDVAAHYRDKYVQRKNDERAKEEENEGKSPDQTTDALAEKAYNSILAKSNLAQANLDAQGESTEADVVMEQTWGRAANTTWWGKVAGERAIANFNEDWPTIVALAENNVDPSRRNPDIIKESFYRYLKHKGVALNSVAGRTVTKQFNSKLAALTNSRTQQSLAIKDEQTSRKMEESLKSVLKLDDNSPARREATQLAWDQYLLHEARKNTYINGVFSPRGSRVINYGQTADAAIERLIKVYNWNDFNEVKDKILSLQIMNIGDAIDPKRPTYLKQREHRLNYFEALFNKQFKEEVEKVRDRGLVQEARKIADHELNPKYNPNSEEFDIKAVWAGLGSAETEDEKKWFGEIIGYNIESGVSPTKHTQMYNAMRNKNWTLYAWHRRQLNPNQLKYYDSLQGVAEFQSLERAGYNSSLMEKEAKDLLNKTVGFKLDTHIASHQNAWLYAKQRFDDIVMSTKFDPKVSDSDRLFNIKKQWFEELSDENGLWETDKGEYIHFNYSHDYESDADIGFEVLSAPSINLEELNETDLISDETRVNIIKNLIRGETPSTPKVLWEIHRRNPDIPLKEIYNGQLRREGIDEKYNFKFDESKSLKATQIDFLRAKGFSGPLPSNPEDVGAISAWYDYNKVSKEERGINLIEPEVSKYIADKGIEYKPIQPRSNDKRALIELYQRKGDYASLAAIGEPFRKAVFFDQYAEQLT
tara:strand:+ start:2038 stop:4524 length:2487 start_codon:yes stop_codon:yes gene_type:complete